MKSTKYLREIIRDRQHLKFPLYCRLLVRIPVNVFLLVVLAVSCETKKNNLIAIPLNELVVDTFSELKLVCDIVPTSTIYDSIKQRATHITGYIQIDKIKGGNNRFSVKVYLKEGRKFAKIDSDQDGSFADEYENKLGSTVKKIELKNQGLKLGKEIKKMSLFVEPFESTLFKPKDDFDLKMIGFALFAIRNNGEFVVQNKYNFSVINYFDSNYSSKNCNIYIRPTYRRGEKEILNKIGDEIHLDRTTYIISSIESDGSKLYLEKRGTTEKQVGYFEGDYALELNGRDLLNGKEVSLMHEKQKLTLLDFWGTWCSPCLEISDELIQLSIEYKHKLNVIGIACDNDSVKVKNYLLKKKVSYSNLGERLDGKISTMYAVRNFPTFILLDSDGKIIFRGSGIDNFKEVAGIISAMKL